MQQHLTVRLDYAVRRKTFSGWEIRPRYISNYELVFILDGTGRITIEGKTFPAQKGDLFFFRPGVLHSLSVQKEPYMEFFGVHFTPETKADLSFIPDRTHVASANHLESQFKTLLLYYRQTDPLARWRQNLQTEQLLCSILTQLQAKPSSQDNLEKVLSHIHEDPFREISLSALCEIAGLQKSAFARRFRQVTGTTPIQYITGLRLEYARDLLLETDLPVSVIAERCGFSDPLYFSRCFKKWYMHSPNRYRTIQKSVTCL